MPKNRQKLISTREAAERLQEHPRSVQRKAESGEYDAVKMPGLRGAYVFTERAVDAILVKRRVEAEQRAARIAEAEAKAAARAAAKAAASEAVA